MRGPIAGSGGTLNLPSRMAVLAACGGVLFFVVSSFWQATPAEYFHALLPPLWIANFLLQGRRIPWPASRVLVAVALALLVAWGILQHEAHGYGGRVAWSEPLVWLYFLTSLALICATCCAVVLKVAMKAACWFPLLRVRLDGLRGRAFVCGCVLAALAPYCLVSFNVHRFKIASATNPQAAYGLAYEEVKFSSAEDNLELSGWFIPRADSDALIVLCHGFGAHKGSVLSLAPFLHRAGFNVFAFDFRGHGESAGRSISFGVREARDIQGAVRYVREKRAMKRIAVYAFSFGASSLLHAMPALPEVQGVVLDSTFSDLESVVESKLWFLPDRVRYAAMMAFDGSTRLELGLPLAAIVPRREINRISPRPLLLIHGLADQIVPSSQAQSNFAAAQLPKQLWLVPGAGHTRPASVRFLAAGEFEHRVAGFFRRCLETKTARRLMSERQISG